jgi:hypothetical protein
LLSAIRMALRLDLRQAAENLRRRPLLEFLPISAPSRPCCRSVRQRL